MSSYTNVLLADSQPSARKVIRQLNLTRRNTLVVVDPDDLRGLVLPLNVRVLDHTHRMSLPNYKAIQENLRLCQATAQPGLNSESAAKFAAALTAVVDERLQDALHCGEAAALLTAAVLDKLAEQVVEVRNCRFNQRTLKALSEQVLADLPEHIRSYRRDITLPSICNHAAGSVSGPLTQIGVVHGDNPSASAVAAAVAAGMAVLGKTGASRVHVSY